MLRRAIVLAVGLVVGMLMAAPEPAFSCKSAGAFKHVGTVTAIDGQALTVTIKDAETGAPITFVATEEQLRTIQLGDDVLIGFVEEEGRLTAVNIRSS